MKKTSYENGQDEFELNSDKDNFPYLTNDELETELDRLENKKRNGEPLEEEKKIEDEEDEEDQKGKLQTAAPYEGFYGKAPGLEGLMSYPLGFIPGDASQDNFIQNPYQNVYQKADNSAKYLQKLAANFKMIITQYLNKDA